MNIQGFYTGREFDADTFFGAHPYEDGTHFAVWAPSARDVKVITSGLSDGSWAEWQMHRSYSGCWEADAAGVTRGTCYQYRVCGADGSVVDHCDPYGTAMTLRPDGRSIVWGAPTCQWTDSAWMAKRSKNFDAPLNIYEAQAGSWRCKEDGTPYTYSELAKQLPAYLKENGYTHLELMPLSEYPFDGSWGYQTTGFFAPTSRYGTPDELCTLIDACHAADIGVIFDFVPVHFAVDEYGLKHFDGTALYEYPAAAVGESEWGSCNFMHSRGEIRCFLQSAADYWLRTFHADGLRMDAVSRLIYWQGDPARGVNGSTLEFLKNMNQGLQQRHPTAMLIAEDSTNFEKVTAPVEHGGLGFDYKWDLGWMNDTLDYENSYVIGDRMTDMQLAVNMGVKGILLGGEKPEGGVPKGVLFCGTWERALQVIKNGARRAEIHRVTGETDVLVSLDLNGPARGDISTGIGFFDHMLNSFARHGLFDLTVKVKGDLEVDCHHSIEDTGIVLGQAIKEAVGDKKGIKRFGECCLLYTSPSPRDCS